MVPFVVAGLDRMTDAAAPTLEELVKLDVGYRIMAFLYQFIAAVATG